MHAEVPKPIIEEICKLGGSIYAVGGAVRDEILGLESKDLDLLVTGIPYDQLLAMLNCYGKTDEVGESFGIIKFTLQDTNETIDVALPRTERSIGAGHKDFEVNFDHTLPVESDLARRDFTINAIAKNLVTGEYVDPYNGLEHLNKQVIHPVYEDCFKDDPLRILRGIQFAARFGFYFSKEAGANVRKYKHGIKALSPERIAIELAKLFEKGQYDQLDFALDSVWLEIFPELKHGYDYGEYPLQDAPKDKELRFLVLMGWSHHRDSVYQPPKVEQLEAICERLKLSSGGFNVPRMLKLYGCAINTSPELYSNSDYDVRRYVAHHCDGSWDVFWDVCKLWASFRGMGSARTMTALGERAFRVKGDPVSLKALAVDGNDALAAGLNGKEIGDALSKLLEDVLKVPGVNQRWVLLEGLKEFSEAKNLA